MDRILFWVLTAFLTLGLVKHLKIKSPSGSVAVVTGQVYFRYNPGVPAHALPGSREARYGVQGEHSDALEGIQFSKVLVLRLLLIIKELPAAEQKRPERFASQTLLDILLGSWELQGQQRRPTPLFRPLSDRIS